MEPTVLGLILDSSVVIEAERQRHTVPQLLRWVFHAVGEAEVAICSITVAELAHGVFRADTAERRECRRSFLDELKRTVPVFPITDEAGEIAGKLSAEGATRGLKLPFDDLLIGACALERGYGAATRNLRHFTEFPAWSSDSFDSGPLSDAGCRAGRNGRRKFTARRLWLFHRTGIFTSGPLIHATLSPRVAVPAVVPSGTRKSTR